MLVGYVTIDNSIEKFLQHHTQSRTLLHAQLHEITTINGKIFDAEDGLGVELLVHELFRLGKRHAHGVVRWLLVSEANLVATAYGEELLRMPFSVSHEKATHSPLGIGYVKHVMGDKMRNGLALSTRELEALAYLASYGLAFLIVSQGPATALLVNNQAMGFADVVEQQGKTHGRVHVGWCGLEGMERMFPHIVDVEGIVLVKFVFNGELGNDGEDDIVILAQHGHGMWPAKQARKLDPDTFDGNIVEQIPQLMHRIRGLGLDGKPELCGKAQAAHDAQGVLGEALAWIADGT